jgi:predicted ribonuclease toxin of YeeF-YezG toxin-antitoxin module
MADLSFSFDPLGSSDAASKALSKVTAMSDTASNALSKATKASSVAGAVSDAASKAMSRANTASNAVSQLDAQVIKSVPTTGSFAVHEIMRTSAGLVKFVYSSTAAS